MSAIAVALRSAARLASRYIPDRLRWPIRRALYRFMNSTPGIPSTSVAGDWSANAWMSKIDAELFERILLRQCWAAAGTFSVLEWGAGRSTLYFADLLARMNQDFYWLSIDYDRVYVEQEIVPKLAGRPYARVIAAGPVAAPIERDPAAGGLDIVVFDVGRLLPFEKGHEQDRLVNLDDYVTYPTRLGQRYDVVFVDGRKRRRCLIEASQLLKAKGVVLAHDAYRTHYHCAFEHYRSHRMVGEILWIGSKYPTNFLKLIA